MPTEQLPPDAAGRLRQAAAVVTAHLRGDEDDRTIAVDEFTAASDAADGLFLYTQAALTLSAAAAGHGDPRTVAARVFGHGPAGEDDGAVALRTAIAFVDAQLREATTERQRAAEAFPSAATATDAAFTLAVAAIRDAGQATDQEPVELSRIIATRAAAAAAQDDE